MSDFEYEYSNYDDSFSNESEQNGTVVITHKTDKDKCNFMLFRGYALELAIPCFIVFLIFILGKLPGIGTLPIIFVFVIIVAVVFLLGTHNHRYNPDFDSVITFNEQGITISRAAKGNTPEKALIYPGFYKPLMEWAHFRYYIFRDMGRGIYILKLRRGLPFRNLREVNHCCESSIEEVSIALYGSEADRAMEAIGSKLPGYNAGYNCIVEYGFHDDESAETGNSEDMAGASPVEYIQPQESAPVSHPSHPDVPRGPIDTSQSRRLRRGESINLSSYVSSSSSRADSRRQDSRRQSSNYNSGSQIEEVEQY